MQDKLTQKGLKEVLNYDSGTGVFLWVVSTRRKPAGERAGSARADGYRSIGLGGVRYLEHRLAFLYVYGRWPSGHLDHINGDTSDNRIDNLRECTPWENLQNRAASRKSTTGLLGVSFHKLRQKWRATIGLQGRQVHLGLFTSKEEAYEAYLAAKSRMHTFQPTPRIQCTTYS